MRRKKRDRRPQFTEQDVLELAALLLERDGRYSAAWSCRDLGRTLSAGGAS